MLLRTRTTTHIINVRGILVFLHGSGLQEVVNNYNEQLGLLTPRVSEYGLISSLLGHGVAKWLRSKIGNVNNLVPVYTVWKNVPHYMVVIDQITQELDTNVSDGILMLHVNRAYIKTILLQDNIHIIIRSSYEY